MKQVILTFAVYLLTLFSSVVWAGKLAIIIDDLGYKKHLDEKAVTLPAPLNLAFLPHTPYAQKLSLQAYQNGHVIMLHQPMASMKGAPLGKGGLTEHTKAADYARILNRNLNSLAHVAGVNNHMGSLLTQNTGAMQQVMSVLKKKSLFFIDSRTSAQSVAEKVAKEYGIASAHRHVFLDHVNQPNFIRRQFAQAVKLAQKKGFAILIAHPYSNSLNFLRQHLPSLYLQNIQLQRLDTYFTDYPQNKFKQVNPPLDHSIFLFGIMP